METTARYWIGVASREHVKIGVSEGFCQLCHGKSAPLKRMKKGDFIIYYSPKLVFKENEPCQKFTAIGKLLDDSVYQVEMFPGFFPFRRNVEFYECNEVEIRPLINALSFIKDKQKWGYQFKYGIIEIQQNDFQLLKNKMLNKNQGD